MGVFDYYEHIQLKHGPRKLDSYHIGDLVPIADGLYCTPQGFVVVVGGKFVASFSDIHVKYDDYLPVPCELAHECLIDLASLKPNKDIK